jgi:serine/threonine-protein kinase
MEFLDGEPLKAVVQREGPLDPDRAIDLTAQVLRAARFAHRRGIVHRDLKPHNVIVDGEGGRRSPTSASPARARRT